MNIIRSYQNKEMVQNTDLDTIRDPPRKPRIIFRAVACLLYVSDSTGMMFCHCHLLTKVVRTFDPTLLHTRIHVKIVKLKASLQ